MMQRVSSKPAFSQALKIRRQRTSVWEDQTGWMSEDGPVDTFRRTRSASSIKSLIPVAAAAAASSGPKSHPVFLVLADSHIKNINLHAAPNQRNTRSPRRARGPVQARLNGLPPSAPKPQACASATAGIWGAIKCCLIAYKPVVFWLGSMALVLLQRINVGFAYRLND
jgi:hypothetical protein